LRVVFLLGCLLLFVLWLLRRWLAGFWLLALIVLVVLGLLFAAMVLTAILRKLCWKSQGSPKGFGSAGHPWNPVITIPSHTYKRPDPMIYSQGYLMSRGLAVTWDNPDVQLLDNGAPVPSHSLQANRMYRVQARIWNGSTEAAAVNMLVRFYYLSFGIGAQRHYIGQSFVDVPVKGAAGLPAVVGYDWMTPATPGHYCLQVELDWPDDENPANNLGQENLDVKQLNSPQAAFTFPVRNDSPRARTIRLEADAYMMPGRLPCRPRNEGGSSGRDPDQVRSERQARHRRELYPVPHGWQVEITPAELALGPAETQNVTVRITSDGSPVTRQAINVNAFAGDELVGGVTMYVHS
jgi:hypothetical protein